VLSCFFVFLTLQSIVLAYCLFLVMLQNCMFLIFQFDVIAFHIHVDSNSCGATAVAILLNQCDFLH